LLRNPDVVLWLPLFLASGPLWPVPFPPGHDEGEPPVASAILRSWAGSSPTSMFPADNDAVGTARLEWRACCIPLSSASMRSYMDSCFSSLRCKISSDVSDMDDDDEVDVIHHEHSLQLGLTSF
jgi:hypothetical protein